MSKQSINTLIRDTYNYLDIKYPQEKYQNCFPSLEEAICMVSPVKLDKIELQKVINTFAYHEIGHIPLEYIKALKKLSQKYILAAIIDIWAPKDAWVKLFKKHGIFDLFSEISFSSECGIVKPSKIPFCNVLKKLDISKNDVVMIGDSVRRDLGGAKAAGIDTILIGDKNHSDALAGYVSLLNLVDEIK